MPKEFARSCKGATAVEFALVAAPFIALLMALVQTGLVFFAERVLDETVEEASRIIMTGQAQSGGLNSGTIRQLGLLEHSRAVQLQ